MPQFINEITRPGAANILAVVRELSQTDDLDAYLQRIVDAACEMTRSEAASISLLEEETGLLMFVAAPLHQRDVLRRMRIPLEKSVAGQCLSAGRPVLVQDARQDPNHFRRVDQMLDFQTRHLAAVPLLGPDGAFGVLEAVNHRGADLHSAPHQYTTEDVSKLECLASLAASAIQNAMLQDRCRRVEQESQQLKKMKTNFISIASHELRTPLGVILGYASLLKNVDLPAQPKKMVSSILESAVRLRKIVEDMNQIYGPAPDSQPEFLHRQAVELSPIIQEVLEAHELMATRKGIALVADLPGSPLPFQGDGDKIAVALTNLVHNAVSFTDEGGHVRISAEVMPGYIKISVADDGIGIPEQEIPHVFERFYQVKSHLTRKHEGLGLGLTVAKAMVELHGGEIWAESAEGQGSNFSFLLPSRLVSSPALDPSIESP